MKMNNIVQYLKHFFFIVFIISNVIININNFNYIIFDAYTIITVIYIFMYILEYIRKTKVVLLNDVVSIIIYLYVTYLAYYIQKFDITNVNKYLKINIIVISATLILMICNQMLNLIPKKNN